MSPLNRQHPIAESMVREYTGLLHRFLQRRLARPQDADDLAQEVFMRLARLEQPELVRAPKAYLCRIAVNLLREFNLRQTREQEQVLFDSEAVDEMAEQSEQALPDRMAERLSLQRQLEAAIEQLPPLQAAMLLLAKRDGLSYKEIAQRTGLNARTIERYVFDAISKLTTMEWDR